MYFVTDLISGVGLACSKLTENHTVRHIMVKIFLQPIVKMQKSISTGFLCSLYAKCQQKTPISHACTASVATQKIRVSARVS